MNVAHRTYRSGSVLITLLMLIGLLAGCTPAPPPPAAPPSGTLRWSIEGVQDITRLDPARVADYQTNIAINLIFGGLVRLDPNLAVVGDGAERWQTNADGTVYTFTLRQNLAYGDGTPVTAQDFADALRRTIAPDTGSAFAFEFLKHIVGAEALHDGKSEELSGVRALDDRTLEITLDSPRGYFLSQLTYALAFVVPPGKIDSAGEDWINRAFGSGPFRVKEHVAGVKLVLEGNPHYWAGPPGVSNIELRFYPDSSAALRSYQAGELDLMGNIQSGIPAQHVAEVRNLPDMRSASAPVVRYIGFNNQHPPFDNVYVRQAFAQAIDKATLTSQVLAQQALPAERILPPGFLGSELPITPHAYDPLGARSALGLAGYSSGVRLPSISLSYAHDTDTQQVAEALQRNWRDTLGIEVELEGMPIDTFVARLDALTADPTAEDSLQLYLSVWGADYPDPHNFLSLQLQSDSPYNNGHWSNPEFDQLTTTADQIGDPARSAERLRLYNQAEQIAVREVGWLPLFNPAVNILIRPNISGLSFTPQGIIAADWTQVRIAAAP
ncbi:extracellular solute-binding protein family 5 [Oscillochloris trichoides DG-6]|uniref:Extracellular solute-binding protein family 5 n=1 Tax=Oscillochloris trichoides DG-6 TaxID=765420 RepID=E1IAJ2_9CHLR|nr:peptide ABC transporter substrate-binding protein [Oscillochloris trichoides]EFO81766.1 extracellular solute-binding protein family 5 [Oscillochloris trichoides DG-6]